MDRMTTPAALRADEPRVAALHPVLDAGLRVAPFAVTRQLDEVEALAGIGSYQVDLPTGRWTSSRGLDAILGLDEHFDRSFEAWVALIHPADRAGVLAYLADEVLERGEPFNRQYRIVRADTGELRWVHGRGALEFDSAGHPQAMHGTIADVTDAHRRALADRRLEQAVAQTSDAVIVVSLDGTIEYVNAAFERSSGYAAAEVIGQPIRMLRTEGASPAFYRTLWRRLRRGRSWTGTLANRNRDGSIRENEVTVTPILGTGDEVTGYISVKRDVTALRATESSLAREFRERSEVAAALARLRPGPTAEATAAEIRDELLALPGIDVALVIEFQDRRRAVPLAVGGVDDLPIKAGEPLSPGQAAYLTERAAQGPWAEAVQPRSTDGLDGVRMAELGIRAFAYAPIRTDRGLLGVVGAGTRDETYARHLIDHLPAVGEFAATAGALLRGPLEHDRRAGLARSRVRRALAVDGLHPVFQPIVALGTGRAVGYEALTRFAEGIAPDQLITDAHATGLGADLELACLAAALDAAEGLDPACWLSLNVSPSVIVDSPALGRLLANRRRRLVLEVTEHVEIADYQAVRRSVARFGPNVCLAVDDAGAGFASLRHVVELVPRYLKLDLSLVRRVDRDLARQAMIAGLHQFADRASCEVIAEGIEDPAELAMLRRLGVPFGQGYLLGRAERIAGPSRQVARYATPRAVRATGGRRPALKLLDRPAEAAGLSPS
jgi:PAS domain S-box-containing protein